MPPVSSGGTALLQMLNIARGLRPRGERLRAAPPPSTWSPRRCAAPTPTARATWATPTFNPTLAATVERLISKPYAAALRRTIRADRASPSSPDSFEWPAESDETTHFSVMDGARNAVALTYTLEDGYGSRIVVPGAGFLLNNEMGDFNAGPGLTDAERPDRHRAQPGGARQAHALEHDADHPGEGRPAVPGRGQPWADARSSTPCCSTILNVVDFGMNIQDALDAPALPPPVAARPHRLRAVRALARHARAAGRARARAVRDREAGRRAGHRVRREERCLRGRRRPARPRRRGGRAVARARTPARRRSRSACWRTSARCSPTSWRS